MLCFWRVKTGLGRDLFLVVYTLIAKTKLVHTPINLIPWPLSSFWSLAILDCILLSSSDFTKLRKVTSVVVLYSELHRMIKELLLWLQALNNSVQCKLSNVYCV